MVWVLMSMVYLASGIAKLRASGLAWVTSDNMAMYEERRVLGRHGTPEQGPQMLQAICKKLTWKLDRAGGVIGAPKEETIATATAFPIPPTSEPAP